MEEKNIFFNFFFQFSKNCFKVARDNFFWSKMYFFANTRSFQVFWGGVLTLQGSLKFLFCTQRQQHSHITHHFGPKIVQNQPYHLSHTHFAHIYYFSSSKICLRHQLTTLDPPKQCKTTLGKNLKKKKKKFAKFFFWKKKNYEVISVEWKFPQNLRIFWKILSKITPKSFCLTQKLITIDYWSVKTFWEIVCLFHIIWKFCSVLVG